MRLREVKYLIWGCTVSKWPTQGLITGLELQSLCLLFAPRVCVRFCMWVSCLVAAFLTTSSLLQSLIGDIDNAMRTFLNYYTVWKQFGGLPEFYNIPQGYTVEKREGYPLRPGKQHLWPMASSQPPVLQTPSPQHLYEVPCLTNAHRSIFYPHLLLPVTLGSFLTRNSISLLFSEKEMEDWLVAMASPRLLGVGARTGTQVSSLHLMLFQTWTSEWDGQSQVDAFWVPAIGILDA